MNLIMPEGEAQSGGLDIYCKSYLHQIQVTCHWRYMWLWDITKKSLFSNPRRNRAVM